MTSLKAPYPYFGGKKSVAKLVWDRLGNVDNYIEPFAGSAAMLLNRPHPGKIETINDADMFVSNFWRSVQADPETTAAFADCPVNESDLHARHRWLVGVSEPEPMIPPEFEHPLLMKAYLAGYARQDGSNAKAFRRRMKTDPNYYDPKIAGWWCWGMCCWIGSGWCANGNVATWEQVPGPIGTKDARGINRDVPNEATPTPEQRPDVTNPRGVNALEPNDKRPCLEYRGTHVKRPNLSCNQGMISDDVPSEKRPGIGNRRGVTGPGEQRPHIGNAHGSGVHNAGPSLSEQVPGHIGGCYARGVNSQVNDDINDKRPHLGGNPMQYGQGINVKGPEPSDKRPHLAGSGGGQGGVHTKQPIATKDQRPYMGGERGAGQGVNAPGDANRPQLADAHSRGRGVHSNDNAGTCDLRAAWLGGWFKALQDRLRTVRVCCGDWKRVCLSESVTTRLGMTGIFFDAPYRVYLKDGRTNRSKDLYSSDANKGKIETVVDEVIAYCVDRGANPKMRIAACGYEGEGYEALESLGWSVVEWKTSGGYANRNKEGNENSKRERIWFSPACINPEVDRMPLFATLIDEEESEEITMD